MPATRPPDISSTALPERMRAVPFDLERRIVTGPPVTLVDEREHVAKLVASK